MFTTVPVKSSLLIARGTAMADAIDAISEAVLRAEQNQYRSRCRMCGRLLPKSETYYDYCAPCLGAKQLMFNGERDDTKST